MFALVWQRPVTTRLLVPSSSVIRSHPSRFSDLNAQISPKCLKICSRTLQTTAYGRLKFSALLMLCFHLASMTNGCLRPADATIAMAEYEQMNRIPSLEVPAVPERNEKVGASATLGPRHRVERKARRWKSSAAWSRAHARYVKAQVKAAQSETAWTPRTTE